MPIMLFVIWFAIFASWTDIALGADLPPGHVLPDPHFTPGRIDEQLTKDEICTKGWSTKSIRPPDEYTEQLKKAQLKSRGFADQDPRHYEEDHDVPLEIAGHPTDPDNLSPEPWDGVCGAHVKDRLENKLHELVCSGQIELREAQAEIAADWVKAYNAHVGRLVCP